jgi:hypothetical protein
MEYSGLNSPMGESIRVNVLLMLALSAFINLPSPAESAPSTLPDNVYSTWGVHNEAHADDCGAAHCVYLRESGEPNNPLYPPYWTSHWVMYRVFKRYDRYPPPYDGKPPFPLEEGADFQSSWGVTYYDTTWRGPQGVGAMEEHYEQFCIPIFPFSNHYSCSIISLGDTAFFVAASDRPSWMPPVCLFSPHNHLPEREFIKHLPYARGDGARLNGLVNGYSFWIGADGKPYQIGVSPDQTVNHGILFGYAFYARPSPDRVNKLAEPYAHPQSFYFSGVPYSAETPLPNAPIVSQNYTDFAMVKPDPRLTWNTVAHLDPKSLPACQLFNPPADAQRSGLP